MSPYSNIHGYTPPPHYLQYSDIRNWQELAKRRRRRHKVINRLNVKKFDDATKQFRTYKARFTRGLPLALAVGAGNFATRNYRQKPVAGLLNLDPRNKILGINNPMYQGGYTRQRIATPKRLYAGKLPPGNPSRKKATNRKNKSNMPKKQVPKTPVQALQKQINNLQKVVAVDKSWHTHRYADAGKISHNNCEVSHTVVDAFTPALIEGYTDAIRFFDPSTPGTLLTADPTVATYSNDLTIKSFFSKLTLRNNYLLDTHVKIYLCKVKQNTNNSPTTAFANAIGDQCPTGGASITTPLLYLSDCERLKEYWSIDCVFDKKLVAGAEAVVSHSVKDVHYDASNYDSEADAYQTQLKGFCWVVYIRGVLGHDSSAAQYGIVDTAVDYEMINTVKILYNSGGIQLNDISFDDNRAAAFTNAGLASVYSIPDNIDATTT